MLKFSFTFTLGYNCSGVSTRMHNLSIGSQFDACTASQLFGQCAPSGTINTSISVALAREQQLPWRVYGSPVYWNGNLYFGSAFGPLRQYNISGATFAQKALGTHNYPGSSQSGRGPLLVVSANGNANGIVWSLENDLSGNGWLRAYDASNVATQLYSSNFGAGKNFIVPTVVNGRVYIASSSTVYVYGLK